MAIYCNIKPVITIRLPTIINCFRTMSLPTSKLNSNVAIRSIYENIINNAIAGAPIKMPINKPQSKTKGYNHIPLPLSIFLLITKLCMAEINKYGESKARPSQKSQLISFNNPKTIAVINIRINTDAPTLLEKTSLCIKLLTVRNCLLRESRALIERSFTLSTKRPAISRLRRMPPPKAANKNPIIWHSIPIWSRDIGIHLVEFWINYTSWKEMYETPCN